MFMFCFVLVFLSSFNISTQLNDFIYSLAAVTRDSVLSIADCLRSMVDRSSGSYAFFL